MSIRCKPTVAKPKTVVGLLRLADLSVADCQQEIVAAILTTAASAQTLVETAHRFNDVAAAKKGQTKRVVVRSAVAVFDGRTGVNKCDFRVPLVRRNNWEWRPSIHRSSRPIDSGQ